MGWFINLILSLQDLYIWLSNQSRYIFIKILVWIYNNSKKPTIVCAIGESGTNITLPIRYFYAYNEILSCGSCLRWLNKFNIHDNKIYLFTKSSLGPDLGENQPSQSKAPGLPLGYKQYHIDLFEETELISGLQLTDGDIELSLLDNIIVS